MRFYLLSTLIATTVLASEFPPNFHHLLKRQDTCASQCDPIGNIAATCTADACFCPTVVSYGPACSSCYLTLNATFASEIGEVVTACESEFPTLKPGGATATPTTAANTAVPCTSQCDPIANIASTCTLDTCYCPTFASYGPACSACYLSINATLAAEIGEVVTACASEVSTPVKVATTPATATAVPCTSQCDALENIAATCTAASCYCPAFISYGSACSSCYATINATLASELGEAITACQIEFSTTASFSTVNLSPSFTTPSTVSTITPITTISSTPATTGSSVSAGPIAGGIVGGIIVLGAIILFVWYKFFRGDHHHGHANNDNEDNDPTEVAPQRFKSINSGDHDMEIPMENMDEMPSARTREGLTG